jgi:hypothetical protein
MTTNTQSGFLALLFDVSYHASAAFARSLVRVCVMVCFIVFSAHTLSFAHSSFLVGDLLGGIGAATLFTIVFVLLPRFTAILVRHPAGRTHL